MNWLLFLLPFFCVGCHVAPWHHSSIRNGDPKYDLAKLTYPPTNSHQGIKLELTRYGTEIHGYIHVKEYTLPRWNENTHETTLIIETNNASRTFVVTLLEGGAAGPPHKLVPRLSPSNPRT